MNSTMKTTSVLFLCTRNSARSQMAEGFLREYGGERFDVHSAGISPASEIHLEAIKAMDESGIDISSQYPKGLGEYLGKRGFNYLIIVCDRAENECPKTFPGVGTRLTWIFDDPRAEPAPEGSLPERFRQVRDQIELKVRDWLDHPEEELRKLKEQRDREHRERMA